jgi:hypothetical protein
VVREVTAVGAVPVEGVGEAVMAVRVALERIAHVFKEGRAEVAMAVWPAAVVVAVVEAGEETLVKAGMALRSRFFIRRASLHRTSMRMATEAEPESQLSEERREVAAPAERGVAAAKEESGSIAPLRAAMTVGTEEMAVSVSLVF